MAISAPHYRIFKSLKPLLPHGGTLLEIGEANWYGDVNPAEIYRDYGSPERFRPMGIAIVERDLFAIAKLFYQAVFAPSRIVSIDMNGTPSALRHDLNQPLPMDEQFDVVINHGTAEHVFNIAQVFATMHDRCKTDGLMIHEAPFTGWIDHGFYCLQPTLFYDLAGANGYEIVLVAIEAITPPKVLSVKCRDDFWLFAETGQIPANSMLFVALRKIADAPFRIPTQGYYARTLSEAGAEAWSKLR